MEGWKGRVAWVGSARPATSHWGNVQATQNISKYVEGSEAAQCSGSSKKNNILLAAKGVGGRKSADNEQKWNELKQSGIE